MLRAAEEVAMPELNKATTLLEDGDGEVGDEDGTAEVERPAIDEGIADEDRIIDDELVPGTEDVRTILLETTADEDAMVEDIILEELITTRV
jgi:hypothetical protein